MSQKKWNVHADPRRRRKRGIEAYNERVGRLGVLAMSVFAAVEGGCAASNPDGAVSGDFITADVDGASVRAAFKPGAWASASDPDDLWVVAGKTSILDGWNLYFPNSVGTTTCPPTWLALFELDSPIICSEGPGAGCSITVTTAALAVGDVVEGTFTATLSPFGADASTARTAVVTNGVFHVTRIQE